MSVCVREVEAVLIWQGGDHGYSSFGGDRDDRRPVRDSGALAVLSSPSSSFILHTHR
jgi:hypothetical protein